MGRKMKDSGIEWIGEAPSSWKCYMLSQLATQVKHKNIGTVEDNLLSLSYGRIKQRSIDAVGGLLPESFEGYNIIEPDDIVLRLTDLQNDHTSLRVGISTQKGIVTSAYLTIRLTSADYPKYVYYYLHTFDICKGLYGMGAGIRQGLTWDGIERLYILLPDLNEQNKIVEYLDAQCTEIDAIIEKTRTSVEEYKHLKQAVITQAVTKGVRGDRPMKDSGIEWIGKIPEDWNLGRIGEIYTERRTKVSDTEYPPLSVTMKGIVPQLSTAAKTDAHDDRKLVCKGDFAINSRSDRRGSCGISAYDGSVSLINTILKPRKDMNPRYYDWLFHTTMFADEFYKWGHGIVDDLWTTNWQDMKNIFIPVPSTTEQQIIASYLDEKCAGIDALIAKKEQLLTELESYKKSLIYEYVTGKKEVAP